MSDLRPTFSVIIPTRDRFVQLAACLESLAKQDYPADRFEVIVVNDGSRSPLPANILDFKNRLNLTVLNQPRSAGPAVSRNIGAKHATADFLAFTDDDCAPAPDWLAHLAAQFQSESDQLIGGRVINALTDNIFSTATHVILDVVYEYYDPDKGRPHFFPTSNLALPATRFRELGGFSEKWPLAAAEDREFCHRWIRRGLRMSHVPDAVIYHRHPLTLASFCHLHSTYGRGAYHYHLLRDGSHGEGGLKPAWAFYWNCFRYAWRRFPPGQAVQVVILLGLWQVFNAVGYVRERLSFRHSAAPPAGSGKPAGRN
jgi:glycosyltransferase involved in cell wall biosynthesis